ncbi:MAG: UbiA family prenyltransferase [Candidatus Micrarchaeota archaeon]
MNWMDYVKAPRPLLAVFFLEVVFGAFYAINFNPFAMDYIKLLIIFFSFQSLYYAIYLINDVVDYESDKLSPHKQKRPIASEKISRKNALIFAAILLTIAFSISYFTSFLLVLFELFFLGYNLLYSYVLKKMPYVDAFAGGVTHAMRFAMGIALFGIFNEYCLILAILLAVAAYTFIKRLKEIKYHEAALHPIEHYSVKLVRLLWLLFGVGILCLLILASGTEQILIGVTLLIYVITILAYVKSKKIEDTLNEASNY